MRETLVLILLVTGWSLLGAASSGSVSDSVTVNLKQGAIQASKVDLEDGKYYYAFNSIPFAEPPVGKLRLKDPVPPGGWTGVKDGSVPAPPCPQFSFESFFAGEPQVMGSEDCLFLSVYTPKPYAADLPVMVWIHGGGFFGGDISTYDPKYFMTKDVVVVSIQYRLGTLGFLSTDDSVIPGNLGLKDQVMALRWVQENIRDLGGDPSKVTIFGESAGGISVHLLMLSPMAKGLFKRAIAQSGTAFIPGFLRKDHRQTSVALSKMLECQGVDPNAFDSQAFYDCLQDVPHEKLVMLGNAFVEIGYNPQVMLPGVDGKFLPDDPMTLVREGKYNKVDFLTGCNRDEGALQIRMLLPDTNTRDILAQNFSTVGATYLNIEQDNEARSYIAKRIFYHYLGTTAVSDDNADAAVKMMGDLVFTIPMDLAGILHARDAAYGKNIFLYELHHLGQFSFLANPNSTVGKHWVAHGDDVQYLFQAEPFVPGGLQRDVDKFMKELMVTLWTNFAATGNPTPDMSLGFKWSPLSGRNRYLILQPSPYMQDFHREEELEFWTNLPLETFKLYDPDRFA